MLSIIIPCYKSLDELEELFPSLEEQILDRDKFEIIVVDDGSSDGTEEYVINYNSQSGISFSFYKQENQGPGAARNLGLENANGDFYIFVDSDVIVPTHWLQEIFSKYKIDFEMKLYASKSLSNFKLDLSVVYTNSCLIPNCFKTAIYNFNNPVSLPTLLSNKKPKLFNCGCPLSNK